MIGIMGIFPWGCPLSIPAIYSISTAVGHTVRRPWRAPRNPVGFWWNYMYGRNYNLWLILRKVSWLYTTLFKIS